MVPQNVNVNLMKMTMKLNLFPSIKSCFSVWAPPLLVGLPGSKRSGKL